jgi:eukaryotic-like serine/threonine-protein kinase
MHKPPPAPVPAVVINPIERRGTVRTGSGELRNPAVRHQDYPPTTDDTRWLLHFIAIAVFLGVLAILAITLLS